MPVTVGLALVFARIKGYKLGYLFKSWVIYPVLVCECALAAFQISVFCGNYFFIQYASVIKTVYLYIYLIPMFVYGLFKAGLIGSAFVFAGTLLNRFVIAQNGGKMPVFPTLSYLTGYVKPGMFSQVDDIHILGTADTKWKFLTDYIDVGWSILSPGDVLIHMFAFVMLYYTIKKLNEKAGAHVASAQAGKQ